MLRSKAPYLPRRRAGDVLLIDTRSKRYRPAANPDRGQLSRRQTEAGVHRAEVKAHTFRLTACGPSQTAWTAVWIAPFAGPAFAACPVSADIEPVAGQHGNRRGQPLPLLSSPSRMQ